MIRKATNCLRQQVGDNNLHTCQYLKWWHELFQTEVSHSVAIIVAHFCGCCSWEVLNCVRSTAWKEKKWFPCAGVSANTIFIPSPAAEKGRELPTFRCFSIVLCPFPSLRKTGKVTEPSSSLNRRPWDGKCGSKKGYSMEN